MSFLGPEMTGNKMADVLCPAVQLSKSWVAQAQSNRCMRKRETSIIHFLFGSKRSMWGRGGDMAHDGEGVPVECSGPFHQYQASHWIPWPTRPSALAFNLGRVELSAQLVGALRTAR